jgi:hypothetical protein
MRETAILVTRAGMGHAEPALQLKLMTTYLRLLLANGTVPGAICLYTDGVKLAVEGSPVLDELRQLEQAGCHVILCQTCLNFYDIAEKVRVGTVGGMGDILAAQATAKKVISL